MQTHVDMETWKFIRNFINMRIKCNQKHHINPSGAETGIFWENYDTTIAADTLGPCVARALTAMILTMVMCIFLSSSCQS